MSDNIKVVVKVRPIITREKDDEQHHQWRVDQNTLVQIDSSGRDVGQKYAFDKVYSENTNTADVYNDVAKPIVEAAVAGFNGTIFAYGQTSSGKTYTMTGTEKYPGIIPLAVLDLFESIKNIPDRDFVVSVSYIEIYNETVRDLLDIKKENIKIQENFDNSVKVQATDRVTGSPDEVLEAMKQGNFNRQTGATNMNESSSRSHSIFQINIESREHVEGAVEVGCVNVSQLNLVDLAGSERAGQTGATGARFKEGTLINKSLSSLALVIKHLSEDPNKYVNYRDSKLTRILQNSLGGNAKTSIICAITPAALEETISTLQFATRAKAIKNKPEVNAVATDATMIQKLTKELSILQYELKSKKNLEEILETKKNKEQDLQNKIAKLQRFILNGFAQRPNDEHVGGVRRRLLPSRRITISTTTLQPIEEDEQKGTLRKFCTPSLKYNASLVQNPADVENVSFKNPSKLKSLPEEPPRLVTPPPNERRVNFNDEIIELDSDDDESTSIPICSPHHDCYGKTKTPPCVLRKNAKLAEKNLQDLVELTEREKMYSPSVVELLEEVENSNMKTMKLQDEINLLQTKSQEKDVEIEALRSKMNITELEIKKLTKISSEFESQRVGYDTKLTEWEIRYETQKNKAKLREKELLSLLEEQKIRPAEDIGKKPFKTSDREIIHFMDMSKDISLVNSDNESSMVQNDDDESVERSVLLDNMHAQLAAKNDIILDLQNNIMSQKKQIEYLENSSQNLLEQISGFKDKLSYFENENIVLQSTVNELNNTIKTQKENMELAQNDIKSYNCVIQELQIKLIKKDNLPSQNVSEEVLEALLANEEKTIANNENLKNLIHSFKLALENSKKEIDTLKAKMSNENNEETVNMLRDDITKLTKQVKENVVTINTLMREKRNFAIIEQEFHQKFSELDMNKKENDSLIREQASLINNLKIDKVKLETSLSDYLNAQKENTEINETVLKQIHEALEKVTVLQEEIISKDTVIANFNTEINDYQEFVNKAKLGIDRLLNVLITFTGETKEIPAKLDSFVSIYDTLNEKLHVLETLAEKAVTQKDIAVKNYAELQQDMADIVTKHNLQVAELIHNIESLNQKVKNLASESKVMSDLNIEKSVEVDKLKLEINNKNDFINKLKLQLELNEQTSEVNSQKDLVLTSLKENEIELSKTIEKLKTETANYVTVLQEKEKTISELKDKSIKELNDKESNIIHCQQKLSETQKYTELLEEGLMKKLCIIIDNIIEKNPSFEYRYTCEIDKIQDQIFHFLERISNYVLNQSPIFIENEQLKSELELISINNKSLKCDLIESSDLLQKLQEELKLKLAELNDIEDQAKEYKEQLSSYDKSMKEQIKFLQLENEKLQTRRTNLKEETKAQISRLTDNKNLSQKTTFNTSSAELKNIPEILSPPSLLAICCEKMSKALYPKQNDSSDTTSSSCMDNINTESSTIPSSEYDELLDLISRTKQENNNQVMYIEQLEIENKELIIEKGHTQREVRLLLEETEELQKKLFNHKTILSILTATTYTENKLLKYQLKGLTHYHRRFCNVCQRDIPEIKKQLNLLMSVLNDDSSICNLCLSNKRKSLPCFLSNNSANSPENESTFDGDLLMLDTNVTIATSDNTLVGYNQSCLDRTEIVYNETGCQTDVNNEEKSMEKIESHIIYLKEQLTIANNKKEKIEKLYNDLVLEIPSIDTLSHKIKVVEDELKIKEQEIAKMTKILDDTRKQIRDCSQENDLLSTQVMEHISENEDLNKEVQKLRQENKELLQAQCLILDKQSNIIGPNEVKISDKPTISKQLDNSKISMDLDESMNFEMAYDSLHGSPQSKKCNISDIQEERDLDLYMVDKNECYDFYLLTTGTEKENLPHSVTILEIMKKFHSTLVTKHGSKVENLVNKLKDYEETQARLITQINDLKANHLKLKDELDEKVKSLNFINRFITDLRENINDTKNYSHNSVDLEANAHMTSVLKEFLSTLDKHFNLSSLIVFDKINNYTEKLVQDHNAVNELLSQIKYQLSEKEREQNLLKATNEKIREINVAVTLDIVKKQQEVNKSIEKIQQKFLDSNLINPDKFAVGEPLNLDVLMQHLEHFINEIKTKNTSEVCKMKCTLEEKERQLQELLSNQRVQEINNIKTNEKLIQYEEIINAGKDSQRELEGELKKQVDKNCCSAKFIEKLSEEILQLKQNINTKDDVIKSITHKEVEASELLDTIHSLQDEIAQMKSINEIISKDAESYAAELKKSTAIIDRNNMDLDKMSSDILVLRESVKEAVTHADSLKLEVHSLTNANIELKRDLEIKCRECQRLEINIKTHEKTVEIQSRMITRLQKLKEEDDRENNERLENLKALTKSNEALHNECEQLRATVKSSYEEIEHLKTAMESLENRLAEFEDSGRRSRASIDAIADISKRRRQSLHDSKRLFDKLEEHKNLEDVFESRQKQEDLYMDCDESLSGRSTPFGLAKGGDSFLPRTEHNDKDEDSRPNSDLARATRRRRQSSYDMHRSVTPQGDLSHYVIDELKEDRGRSRMDSDNEVTQLKTQLASCDKELEELKEKYRELDEECEICSEYLQERDKQCSQLKKEKAALEKQVAELKTKCSSVNNSFSFTMKPSVAHVCVNTDEDWTNLHSVVVDRMSYDAEVEKNKRLNKTIEELRFKKLDLRKKLDKMQKTLERYSAKDNSQELERTKQELRSCKAELDDLRTRYKELDDQCELCAAYLKEREEQCRSLKEARADLEGRLRAAEEKLKELLEKSVVEHSKSMRKKRQTMHDMNRPETAAVDLMDASTETISDSSQRVPDDSALSGKSTPNIQYLKKIIERLTMQKAQLENKLRIAYSANPICVATGSAIVQNQQITDIMEENQKLKKKNAKLVNICKKRGKSANIENEDPCEQ